MDLLDQISAYLDSVYEMHMFFMFDPSELSLYNKVPELINKTCGHDFWDITIGAVTYERILNGLDTINDRTKRLKIITQRLCTEILQKVGIDAEDYLDAHELESYMVDLCEKAGAVSLRVNVMLDEVNDIDLQIAINDLMADSGLTFFCYATHAPITMVTSVEEDLTYGIDYGTECSELFNYNYREDFERKIKR